MDVLMPRLVPLPPHRSAKPGPTGEGLGGCRCSEQSRPCVLPETRVHYSPAGGRRRWLWDWRVLAWPQGCIWAWARRWGARGARSLGGAACGAGAPGSRAVRGALSRGRDREPPDGGRAGEGTFPVPGRPPWQRLPRSAALINAGPWLERPPAAQLRPVICRSLFLHPRLLKSVFPHTGSGPQVMGKTHRLRPPRGPPGFLSPPQSLALAQDLPLPLWAALKNKISILENAGPRPKRYLMAGTCKEFVFHFAQSQAPPGRDLALSKLRPREPSRIQTPPAVGGWGLGLCGVDRAVCSEPGPASRTSQGHGAGWRARRGTGAWRGCRARAGPSPGSGEAAVRGWSASCLGYCAQGKAATF